MVGERLRGGHGAKRAGRWRRRERLVLLCVLPLRVVGSRQPWAAHGGPKLLGSGKGPRYSRGRASTVPAVPQVAHMYAPRISDDGTPPVFFGPSLAFLLTCILLRAAPAPAPHPYRRSCPTSCAAARPPPHPPGSDGRHAPPRARQLCPNPAGPGRSTSAWQRGRQRAGREPGEAPPSRACECGRPPHSYLRASACVAIASRRVLPPSSAVLVAWCVKILHEDVGGGAPAAARGRGAVCWCSSAHGAMRQWLAHSAGGAGWATALSCAAARAPSLAALACSRAWGAGTRGGHVRSAPSWGEGLVRQARARSE